MREKIEKIIEQGIGVDMYDEPYVYGDTPDKILSLMKEEIEKVENPIQNIEGIPQADFVNYDRGFDKAKYLILTMLKEER